MSELPLSEDAKTATLTDVNQGIVRVAKESFAEEQEWDFFCECGEKDCQEHVSLTIDVYAALHDNGQAVLADGHRLSQLERSRRLRSEAEALTGQAEHQVKRAQRNLRSEGVSDEQR